jgi:hypothetical protein
MGIASNTLDRFINGAKPRVGSMRRLMAWYEAEAGEVDLLRRSLADVRKKLAECEGEAEEVNMSVVCESKRPYSALR